MLRPIIIVAAAMLALTACYRGGGSLGSLAQVAPAAPELDTIVVSVPENPIPGTVQQTWVDVPPDMVDVPGQIDPAGNYYRKPHKTLYENRPGRYQIVEFPDDRTK